MNLSLKRVIGQLFKDDGKPAMLESIEKEVKRLITDPVANHNQKHPATSPMKVVLSVISYIKGCFSFSYYSTSNVVFFSLSSYNERTLLFVSPFTVYIKCSYFGY